MINTLFVFVLQRWERNLERIGKNRKKSDFLFGLFCAFVIKNAYSLFGNTVTNKLDIQVVSVPWFKVDIDDIPPFE